MPYCSRCGVEVESSVEVCPLCDAPIQKFNDDTSDGESRYPERFTLMTMSSRKKRLIAWFVFSLLFVTAFLVVLAVNLVKDGTISWGSYALAGIGAAWIYVTLLLFFIRKVIVVIAGNFAVTAGFLVLLDLFNGTMDWFLRLGLPVAGMVAVATVVIVVCAMALKERVAVIMAVVLFTAGVFCIGLDLLVSGYLDAVRLSWSFIVLVSIYPVALLFLIYHFVLRRYIDLERLFHL